MDFEEVIWKQGRDTIKQGKCLHAIGAPQQGVLRCSERGQSLLQVIDCNVASRCAGELSSKKRGSQAPEATGSCCVCVCATEWQKWQTELSVRGQSSSSHSACSPAGRAVVCYYQDGLLKEQPSHLLLAGGEGLQLDHEVMFSRRFEVCDTILSMKWKKSERSAHRVSIFCPAIQQK